MNFKDRQNKSMEMEISMLATSVRRVLLTSKVHKKTLWVMKMSSNLGGG